MSCGDEFIASSHRGQIGIHLWANNCFYNDVLSVESALQRLLRECAESRSAAK